MLPPTNPRNHPRALILGMALMLVPAGARTEEPTFSKKTYTYKTVDGVAIRADVYRTDDHRMQPAVIWLHGGALIVGSRGAVPRQLLDLCRREGFTLVSFDYRLAPETKLPAILEDVLDAFAWVGGDGARRYGFVPGRLGVVGHSAGGYLTLLAGAHLSPRPLALASFYGYGDVAAAWYSRPDPFYLTQPAVTETSARAAVGRPSASRLPGCRGRRLEAGPFRPPTRRPAVTAHPVSPRPGSEPCKKSGTGGLLS